MSTLSKKHYTIEEYFELERSSEEKYQYYHGEVFAMAGASASHNRVSINLTRHLGNRLAGGPCEPFPAEMRIKCPTKLYTYADASIVCGKPEFEICQGLDTLLNPTVVFEILSPSTESYDRGKKFEHYRTILSLQEYVLIAQDHSHVAHFIRQPDKTWRLAMLDGFDATLTLSTVEVAISLRELYERVEFPPESEYDTVDAS